MLALIDGDLVLYRSAASAENEDFSVAVDRASDLLKRLVLETNSEGYKFFLTGKHNFRKTVYPEYKANRLATPKPIHLEALRKFAVTEFNAEVIDLMEADDAMGIYQTDQTIIISLDKDMLQVPGKHYSWGISGTSHGKEWVREAKFRDVTKIEGLRHFYKQCIMGDTSDNVKGVVGLGEKTAEKMLKDCTMEVEMFNKVRNAYNNDQEFLLNGRVLYILRTLTDDWKVTFDSLI